MSKNNSNVQIALAVSLFFTVRGVMRTTLAQGRKLDPTSWLRIETLKFIADTSGPSMRQVADYLSITAPSATSLVSGLVRDGLVARSTDARDRRTAHLHLTTKGKTVLAETLARGTELLGALFAPLSRTELAAFISTLQQIRDQATCYPGVNGPRTQASTRAKL
jgi:DNA-binding MarR family transcriptional regulator